MSAKEDWLSPFSWPAGRSPFLIPSHWYQVPPGAGNGPNFHFIGSYIHHMAQIFTSLKVIYTIVLIKRWKIILTINDVFSFLTLWSSWLVGYWLLGWCVICCGVCFFFFSFFFSLQWCCISVNFLPKMEEKIIEANCLPHLQRNLVIEEDGTLSIQFSIFYQLDWEL